MSLIIESYTKCPFKAGNKKIVYNYDKVNIIIDIRDNYDIGFYKNTEYHIWCYLTENLSLKWVIFNGCDSIDIKTLRDKGGEFYFMKKIETAADVFPFRLRK